MIDPNTALPNVRQALVLSRDEGVSPLINRAERDPVLGKALAAVPGYTDSVRRIDALLEATDGWMRDAPQSSHTPQDMLRQALDSGSTKQLPEKLSKAATSTRSLHDAVAVAYRLAEQLASERAALVREHPDETLSSLDEQLIEGVAALSKARADLDGAGTIESAVAAGKADEWQAAQDAAGRITSIRAAQRSVVRCLVGGIHELVADDARKWVAVVELADWHAVAPDLPQVLRWGGLWSTDSPNVKGRKLTEKWSEPWPRDGIQRTDWLIEHHRDQLRVPRIEDMHAAWDKLNDATRRATPTGGTAEPHTRQAESVWKFGALR